jgi:hypothetical protein
MEDERTHPNDIGNATFAQEHQPAPDGLQDKIARRAYEHYEERGRKPGHALYDWLRAEREVQQRRFVE